MSFRRLFFSFLLCLFFSLHLFSLSCVSGDKRSTIMDMSGDIPGPLGSLSKSILHSTPRYNGAPKSLPQVKSNDPQGSAKPYMEGLIVPFCIPLLLALLMYMDCCVFCSFRCCCDKCGGRHATRKYEEKEQKWLKITLLLMFAGTITLFGIGLVSNSAISKTLDKAYVATDKVVEYIYSYYYPFNSMLLATEDAYTQAAYLNNTIFPLIPSAETCRSYQQCLAATHTLLKLEMQIQNDITALIFNTSASSAAAAAASSNSTLQLGALNARLASTQQALLHLNNFTAVNSGFLGLNNSLAFFAAPTSRVPSIQTNIQRTYSSIVQVNNGNQTIIHLRNLQDYVVNNSTGSGENNIIIQPLLSYINQYSFSLSLLPNLTQLYMNISTNTNAPANIQSSLIQLNTSLSLLPDFSAWNAALVSYDIILSQLTANTSALLTALTSYRSLTQSLLSTLAMDLLAANSTLSNIKLDPQLTNHLMALDANVKNVPDLTQTVTLMTDVRGTERKERQNTQKEKQIGTYRYTQTQNQTQTQTQTKHQANCLRSLDHM